MKRLISFLIIFTTLVSATLFAARTVYANTERKGSSVLTGVVLGPNDKPVPRAAITYQSSSGNAPHVVHTDAHGRCTISKLAADDYDLRATANGVFSEWEKNVPLRTGQTREIILRLIYAKQMPKSTAIANNSK